MAEAARYARRFGAIRIIHRADASAMAGAEQLVDGDEAVQLNRDFFCIPVLCHTPGSIALLYQHCTLRSRQAGIYSKENDTPFVLSNMVKIAIFTVAM